jgi:acetoacetyl-[acyl-carrier protein] synthase
MTALPLIVGMGGVNAAGRTSFHQGFRRIVIDKLAADTRRDTFVGLATLMNLLTFKDGKLIDNNGQVVEREQVEASFGEQILNGTLIRKIEKDHFDPDATHWHQKMTLTPSDHTIRFETLRKQLPFPLPATWTVTDLEEGKVKVEIHEDLEIKHDTYRNNPIKSAGQFPTGFDMSGMYNTRYQPRGLQATVFAATDAIRSTGIDWEDILTKISPDEVGTYSASVFGQAHSEGVGGMMQNRLRGERVTTKNLALGLNTMPTDFINAYVTGNVGTTFTSSGACATFLYNLRAAVQDIKAGRTRVAIVGSCDTAVTPEVIEGFGNMSALANEDNLKKLDGVDQVDYRRTSRPFGDNCGFTIGEGAQVLVLMDDALVVEMGANYVTMAKSVALAQSIIGSEAVKERSFILAHGSSTPQNRVTESLIYHRVATTFGIENWPVVAPKAYVGHTIGPASGDQVALAAGVFADNIMPGITTIEKVADDVYDEHLNIATEHWHCPDMDVAFINSKGFGGNNATATMFSPKVSIQMIAKRHGESEMAAYYDKHKTVQAKQLQYRQAADNGQFDIIYRFGQGMIDEGGIVMDQESMTIPGFSHAIDLTLDNPFDDMV